MSRMDNTKFAEHDRKRYYSIVRSERSSRCQGATRMLVPGIYLAIQSHPLVVACTISSISIRLQHRPSLEPWSLLHQHQLGVGVGYEVSPTYRIAPRMQMQRGAIYFFVYTWRGKPSDLNTGSEGFCSLLCRSSSISGARRGPPPCSVRQTVVDQSWRLPSVMQR